MSTADRLVECSMMDIFPETPTCADYGIESQEIFGLYQQLIRAGKINAQDLHQCLFKKSPGEELTKLLCRFFPEAPKIHSVYDGLESDE